MKRSPVRALTVLASVLLVSPVATAQAGYWLGVTGGYGWARPDIETNLPILKGKEASGGLVAGVMGEGVLGQTVSIVSEVSYSRRRVSNTYYGGTSGGVSLSDVTADYTFDYLEVANSLKLAAGSRAFRPYGLAGVVVSFPLRIESVNTAVGSQPFTENVRRQFSSNSWALNLGAGFDYHVKDGTAIFLEGRYYFPLSNSTKSNVDTWKWRDWRILVGIKFRT